MTTPNLRNWLALLLLATTLPACAESNKHGSPLPVTYTTECGSCHTPFPARGLGADDWRQMMAKLDKHFGDNASLDAPARKEIEDYLVRNAGTASTKVSPGGTARLTQSAWFARKHHEINASVWKDVRIKSAANCTACHPRANEGRYSEHEIKMPAGMKWED